MKRFLALRLSVWLAASGCCLSGMQAQEAVWQDSLTVNPFTQDAGTAVAPAGEFAQGTYTELRMKGSVPVFPADTVPPLSIGELPLWRTDAAIGYFPDFYYGVGVGLWNLHEGFNASLNMSVCASFGKHRFPGVGFGTGVSAMYAHRLTERLMMAVGGFYDRMSWGSFNENRVGMNLMFGYQLTDRVSVYAYGSKAFTPSTGPMRYMPPVYWMDRYRERFGGMIHVKVSDAMSFSVSVEGGR